MAFWQECIVPNVIICIISSKFIRIDMFVDLPSQFINEVQSIVKMLYQLGQNILHNKNHSVASLDGVTGEASLGGHGGSNKSKTTTSVLNPVALTIQTNVCCIELLLWAIKEDTGMTFIDRSVHRQTLRYKLYA